MHSKFGAAVTGKKSLEDEETSGDQIQRQRQLTEFEQLRKERLRPLIEVNDKVNALTSAERNINSTRIVVAGDQSHGKTSLLEALSGVDLPRGEGIVTRVPLILQLRDCSEDEDEYGTISAAGVEPFCISLNEVGENVGWVTGQIAGDGKDVKDTPIELKIYRKGQDDLTLIDLPGITRVALDDQAGGDDKKLEELIMKMCRRYMTPKESILLNVVSAMVDFTTSASLQLSRELDPMGYRTMVCVTKIDQHREKGLHEKVTGAISKMKLRSDSVFCVRNRSQKENDDKITLGASRTKEMVVLKELTEGRAVGYRLGVKALSKTLVERQCADIMETLPTTRIDIENRIQSVTADLAKLGEAVGDLSACRSKAMQLIDSFTGRLKDEAEGTISPIGLSARSAALSTGDIFGESLEINLAIPDFQARRSEKQKVSALKVVKGCEFWLIVHTSHLHENSKGDVVVQFQLGESDRPVESITVTCEFLAKSADKTLKHYEIRKTYDGDFIDGGYIMVNSTKADVLESLHVSAAVYVEEVAYEEGGNDKESETLFCSRLSQMDEDFTTNIDKLYTSNYFFSTAFRKTLAKNVKAIRGGTGLPGSVSPRVALVVLENLRSSLPAEVRDFRDAVYKDCIDTIEKLLNETVDAGSFPRFQKLLSDASNELIQKKLDALVPMHAKMLEWEANTLSTNHYYMDTFQSMRAKIFDGNDDEDDEYESEKPNFGNLNPKSVQLMSNEDQNLVDLQIRIFAYWKLMKKRFVDYVILSTRNELVSSPVKKELKSLLLEAAFGNKDDTSLLKLMSPSDDVVEKRHGLVTRLQNLQEAANEIAALQRHFRDNKNISNIWKQD